MTARTHNSLTQRYLDAFAAQSELTVADLQSRVHPRIADTTYQGRTLTRPGLLERAQVDQLAADLETLYRCVTSLPDRLFGGDLGAFAASSGDHARRRSRRSCAAAAARRAGCPGPTSTWTTPDSG